MTVEEFEAGILKCKVEYNTHKNIWTRLFDSAANFKHALIYLAVNYINRKEIYNKKGIKIMRIMLVLAKDNIYRFDSLHQRKYYPQITLITLESLIDKKI